MYLQISKIVLWPRRDGVEPRVLNFDLGAVNVISGASKTGKSAVIPIIDYCLGSEKCAIPVKTIRDACKWFGVVVVTNDGEMLLARREPGDQRSTGDMYMLEGKRIELPRMIEAKNTSVDIVKGRLDEMAGLVNVGFDPNDTSGFKGRPSFRDLLAFNFQPQSIIANRDVLFFKAESYEHREKLKTIFPYVLGAITPEVMARSYELESVRRELRKREKEFRAARDASSAWVSEAEMWLSQASELGLRFSPVGSNKHWHDYLRALREVCNRTSLEMNVSPESVEKAVQEGLALQSEESRLAGELGGARRRLEEMERLRDGAQKYGTALEHQRARLQISDWLADKFTGDSVCPLCSGGMGSSHDAVLQLQARLREVEVDSARFRPAPAAFEAEFGRVKEEIRLLSESIQAARHRRKALESRSDEQKGAMYKWSEVDRFLGKLEQALRVYEQTRPDSELSAELARLREHERTLLEVVSESRIKEARDRALRRVTASAGRILPRLDAERPNDPIELSIEDLTVKITGDGRDDFLWEIGSAANWLSYHLAVSIALQEFFLASKSSPVPGLLVFDQPSQAYFPRQFGMTKDGEDPSLNDEDTAAVRRAFEVFGSVTSEWNGQLQMIVLEHAPEAVWAGIPGVRLVEEWRGGRTKLVPMEWLAPEPTAVSGGKVESED